MIEEYKDIPGYEGLYQVSNFGNVKSLNYNRTGIEKTLKSKINKSTNYCEISLCKNGKMKSFAVHQLVAMAFLKHIPEKYVLTVNHIDNNKLNNNISNLEVVPVRYNTSCHKTDPGINWREEYKFWEVRIRINKDKIYLGSSKDKEKALQLYKRALDNIHLYDGDKPKFKELINK